MLDNLQRRQHRQSHIHEPLGTTLSRIQPQNRRLGIWRANLLASIRHHAIIELQIRPLVKEADLVTTNIPLRDLTLAQIADQHLPHGKPL